MQTYQNATKNATLRTNKIFLVGSEGGSRNSFGRSGVWGTISKTINKIISKIVSKSIGKTIIKIISKIFSKTINKTVTGCPGPPMGQVARWAPTVVGLCCIPFLPYIDPPAERAIDAAFAAAWPEDGTLPEKKHH